MTEKRKNGGNSPNVFICIAEGEKITPLFQVNLSAEAIKNGYRQVAFTQSSNEIPVETLCEAFYLWNNNKLIRVETEMILYV